MKPPPRLLDDPALAPELRNDLERAATAKPEYDVSAGLAGLQAAIIAGAAASASAPSSAAAAAATHAGNASTAVASKAASAGIWSTLAAKITVASLVTAATVTTTVIAWPTKQHEHTVAPHAKAAAPAASQAPPPAIVPAAPLPTTPTPSPTNTTPAALVPAAAVPVPVHVLVHDSPLPSSSPTPTSTALRREIDQLARIKTLVDSDPAQAYRLAQQGDREFARGVLRQEREALAIVALANSNRRPEAARRLSAFVTRYPHSPARERLEQLLGTVSE